MYQNSHLAAAAALFGLSLAVPTVAQATDWYWINDFGGTWDEEVLGNTSWQDPSNVYGLPGPGDNAFLVLPYSLSFCPMGESWEDGNCITQPVPVVFRSDDDPALDQLVLESQNVLSQLAGTPSGQNDLSSNVEIVGGSGLAFTPPSDFNFVDPPGVFPVGTHIQEAGNNTVGSQLTIGGIATSEGLYDLSGGELTVGDVEIVGFDGSGRFVQSGGTHTVGNELHLGRRDGSGSFQLLGGTLEVQGSPGLAAVMGIGTGDGSGGELFQDDGSLTVNGALNLGWGAGSSGRYELTGPGQLDVGADMAVGVLGTGEYIQSGLAMANVTGDLILAREAGSIGRGLMESSGALTVGAGMTVGQDGEGEFTQQGPVMVDVGADLTLGENEPAEGTYTFVGGGTGSLVVGGDTVIGSEGTGTFQHESGLHTTSQVILGGSATGDGTYNLVDGDLEASFISVAGDSPTTGDSPGVGVFTQEAGSVEVTATNPNDGALNIGVRGDGRYDLQDGELTVARDVVIGSAFDAAARGAFTQSSGTHTIMRKLQVSGTPAAPGDPATASYELLDGVLDVSEREDIGAGGEGLFTQEGGAHAVGGDLVLGETLRDRTGTARTGSGRYEFEGGTLTVAGDLRLGQGNPEGGGGGTGTFVHNDLTFDPGSPFIPVSIAGDLEVGERETTRPATGTYEFVQGKLQVERDLLVTHIDSEFVQMAGFSTTDVLGDLKVRAGANYRLDGGVLDVRGTAGVDGTASTFFQTGGDLIAPSLQLRNGGSFTLEGEGVVSATRIELRDDAVAGLSVFNQRDGEVFAGTVSVGLGDSYILSDGTLEAGSILVGSQDDVATPGGLLALNGGSVDASRILVNRGNRLEMGDGLLDAGTIENFGTWQVMGGVAGGSLIENRGTWDFEAGEVSANRVDNYGTWTMSDGLLCAEVVNYGTWEITGGTIDALSLVENEGTLKITDTVVVYARDFVTSGGYISDPATSTFGGALTVTASGYLQGGLGDVFVMQDDFLNGSEQITLWDTDEASLIFDGEGAIEHILGLAGEDLGALGGGFTDNFAFGSLDLDEDDTLVLVDGNAAAGAALYVRVLAEALDLDAITSAFNIYYDATRAENDWLGGLDYALTGGGSLIAAIPEPGTLPLLGLSLAGIAWRRKRCTR